MTEDDRLKIFKAQTSNVRELNAAWRQINRSINQASVANSRTMLAVQTRMLALIYCALAEATFSKMIHTPHGLTLDEVRQVKSAVQLHGVQAGWTKCAELATARIAGTKSNHQQNVLKKLSELIRDFIFDASLIRNKLAHGQWAFALNRDNTAVNEELTKEIADLTVLVLDRRRSSLQGLSRIIEDIVESPNRTHYRDYWTHLNAIENGEREMQGRSLVVKRQRLLAKRQRVSDQSVS